MPHSSIVCSIFWPIIFPEGGENVELSLSDDDLKAICIDAATNVESLI